MAKKTQKHLRGLKEYMAISELGKRKELFTKTIKILTETGLQHEYMIVKSVIDLLTVKRKQLDSINPLEQ